MILRREGVLETIHVDRCFPADQSTLMGIEPVEFEDSYFLTVLFFDCIITTDGFDRSHFLADGVGW